MLKLFITATDTDAGKTYATRVIARAFTEQKLRVSVYKPVSAGCENINGTLVNEDAALLLAESNTNQRIEQVNPIAFEPAIAPHIAAAIEERDISIANITSGYQRIEAENCDVLLCEGAGGWRLPLGKGKFLSEFTQQTAQNVILVVNVKLGCLNHAVLTYDSIISDGLNCVGWIANCQEDMLFQAENIAELTHLLPVPKLAVFAHEPDISKAVKKVDIVLLNSLL